ncbi:LysR family transcriptional regulator [Telmatospirillum siberiense]|nr:LysR family transcriptional regulator [Telmatospirillum siberiense]
MTLHQLRIFCAVVQAATMTRAGKQLGLAQPTLSQQLSKLEESVGTRLFDRTGGQMTLTEAGQFLARQAQMILNDFDSVEAGLREFSSGHRGIIRLAGLNSIIRVLMPEAIARLAETFAEMEFDIHEVAPAEALELLYGRSVNIGLIAANSVAQSSLSFIQIPVMSDPYVFAVPSHLKLSAIGDPGRDLPPPDRKILNSSIQFNFGTQHTQTVAQWYQQVLPHHRQIAQCRSYEVALSMVRAGLGVCLIPALAAHDRNGGPSGIDLYATDQPDRQMVALVPAQYCRVDPYKTFLHILQETAGTVRLPKILPMPPFIRQAAARRDERIAG